MFLRLILFAWILAANSLLILLDIDFSWAIFISCIMFTSLNGDLKNNFLSVEIGGAIGLILAFAAIQCMQLLSGYVGLINAVIIPLAVVLFVLIVLNPKLPVAFNNTGFAYFTCAFISPTVFIQNFSVVMLLFLIGSVVVNCVTWFLISKLAFHN